MMKESSKSSDRGTKGRKEKAVKGVHCKKGISDQLK